MDDAERARFDHLVLTWRASAADVIAFLRNLLAELWATPSELDGWDVHAVAAHLAHLESVSAGFPQTRVDLPNLPRLESRVSQYTEAGVIARQDDPPAQVIDELERAVEVRARMLADDPPASLADRGDGFARLMGWTWDTLLRNRIIDLWMHEQDIRRVVDRPGNLETAGARQTRDLLVRALPYILAKRAQAATGSSVLVRATGPGGTTFAAEIRSDARGYLIDPDELSPATATISLPFSEWVRRSGGRGADPSAVQVSGDAQLGEAVLANLTVTF